MPDTVNRCRHCNKYLKKKKHGAPRKWCDRRCANAQRNVERNIFAVCKVCGLAYKQTRTDQVVCSPVCNVRLFRAKAKQDQQDQPMVITG